MSTSEDPLTMYIAVRTDLHPPWPLGAVIAQACHASTAVLWEHKDDDHVLQYMKDIDRMRKVVLQMPSEGELIETSAKLRAAGIAHKLWIEQPENYSTCLAVKPYPKSIVAPLLKAFKLLK